MLQEYLEIQSNMELWLMNDNMGQFFAPRRWWMLGLVSYMHAHRLSLTWYTHTVFTISPAFLILSCQLQALSSPGICGPVSFFTVDIMYVIVSKVDGIFFSLFFYIVLAPLHWLTWLCFCFLIAGLRVGWLLNALVIIVMPIALTILCVFQSTGARSLRGGGPLALAGCATSRLFSADSGQ